MGRSFRAGGRSDRGSERNVPAAGRRRTWVRRPWLHPSCCPGGDRPDGTSSRTVPVFASDLEESDLAMSREAPKECARHAVLEKREMETIEWKRRMRFTRRRDCDGSTPEKEGMPPVDSAQPGTRNGREEAPNREFESGEVDRVAPGAKPPSAVCLQSIPKQQREASPVLPARMRPISPKQGVHLSL